MSRALIIATALALAGLVAACSSPRSGERLQAQGHSIRTLPEKSLRGDMTFSSPPEVVVDGRPMRLAPGSRIRGENNLVQTSSTLVGQRVTVNYTLDIGGQVLDVWLLSSVEKSQFWPRSAEQAQQWRFDATSQRWSRP
jgi:hypothetical protein